MKLVVRGALLAAGTALALAAAPATPATAATSGSETLSGVIVFAAVPDTNTRTVVSSVVRAKGVFRGVGSTGQFADATGSFTGTISGLALLVRDPDGSCSFSQVPRHEVDKLAESGTLSF